MPKAGSTAQFQSLKILMSCRATPDQILWMDVDNFVMPASSGDDHCATGIVATG